MEEHQDVIAELMSITGADHAEALNILEATDFNLSNAIDLFFAKADGAGGASTAALGAGLPEAEEEVRAPIPIKRERLFGDYAPIPIRSASRPEQVYDAFRDFQAENAGTAGASSTQGLAKMFEPPKGLLFQPTQGGGLDEAKGHAVKENKWLLVNVQSNDEFASYQLNRDTWSNPAVSDIIQGSFVFWQVQHVTDAGARLMSSYQLTQLPAVLVIDPVTGAKVRMWTGFLEPDRMIEDLVPFLDHSFSDPAAAMLATSQLKRKHSQNQEQELPRALTEDEELEAALAASLHTAGPSDSAPAVAPAEAPAAAPAAATAAADEMIEDAEAAGSGAGVSPEHLQAQALASLGMEPGASDPEACRVGFRLPDGRRTERRFASSAHVQLLHTFCRANDPEAAAGRAFYLCEPYPGAPELADLTSTIAAANLANSMVVMKWRH